MAMIVYPINGVTYNAEDVQAYMSTRSSGVFAAEGNFEIGTIDGRNIPIGPGLAWMKYSNQFSGVSVALTEGVTVSITGSSSTFDRKDRIVLRLNLTTDPYSASIVVLEGTAASSPKPPNIIRNSSYYDLGLYVVTAAKGRTYIDPSKDILSTKSDPTVCGIMIDGNQTVDTSFVATEFNNVINQAKQDRTKFVTDSTNSLNQFNANSSAAITQFNNNSSSALSTFNTDKTDALDAFATEKDTAINNFETAGQVKIAEIDDNGDDAIDAFNESAETALNNLRDSVNNIAGGTDYMLQTVFNPDGKYGQVAFADDVMPESVFNPDGIYHEQVAFAREVKNKLLRGYWTPINATGGTNIAQISGGIPNGSHDDGSHIVIQLYPLKYAGDRPTSDEQRLAQRYIDGDESVTYDSVFDTSKETIYFQSMRSYLGNREQRFIVFYGFYDGYFSKIEYAEGKATSYKIVKLIQMEAL